MSLAVFKEAWLLEVSARLFLASPSTATQAVQPNLGNPCNLAPACSFPTASLEPMQGPRAPQ